MTSSKQRRLSTILVSTFLPPKEEEPEVLGLSKSSTSAAILQSAASQPKVSRAQRHLKALSSIFQHHDTKSSGDLPQQPDRPAPAAPRPLSTGPISNGKLRKATSPPNALQAQQGSPDNGSSTLPARGRHSHMAPPPFDGPGHVRSVSSPPPTAHLSSADQSVALGQTSPPRDSDSKLQKSHRGKSKKGRADSQPNLPRAWVVAGQEKKAYDVELLKKAEKVPELWNEEGNTYVYLFPRTAGLGPSFKISSMVLADSAPLMQMAWATLTKTKRPESPPQIGSLNFNDSQTISDESNYSTQSLDSEVYEHHLYYPISLSTDGAIDEANARLTEEDLETLITARNLFAFLTGQPLVATSIHPTIFTLFLGISHLLKTHEFTNSDGSSFGDAVTLSFSSYIDELRLADVRHSREKTIEAIILGERMRSTELYNEAFAHGVGKYDAIKALNSTLFSMISKNTQARMERASMELSHRQKNVGFRLTEFDFPSLWSGVAGSTSSVESKLIRFKYWKNSFLEMRKFVIHYYKHQFGSWPPKASSKKNNFVESGLNREVLMTLYDDLCALYDLLVDRTSRTTRTIDSNGTAPSPADDPLIVVNTFRRILAEYDSSSPPVQPPIPFDVPNLPSRTSINERHIELPLQEQVKLNNKKLKDNESLILLAKSHNLDSTLANKRPFIEEFKAFEAKAAKHRNTVDIIDQRYGHWLFMYVVLQSLPLLVVDAPGVRFNEGVEYFLCAPPRGGLPWVEQQENKAWFGVAGGAGMVELPKDIVEYGVVATYERSHCWIVGEQWQQDLPNPSVEEGHDDSGYDLGTGGKHRDPDMPNFDNDDSPPFSPLLPPPSFSGTSRPDSSGSERSRRSRSGSPSTRYSVISNSRPRNSFYGLEPLPIEPTSSRRISSQFNLEPPQAIGGERGHSRVPSGLSGDERRHSRVPSGSLDERRHSRVPSGAGMSFDDILGGMDSPGSKGKDKKKKK